MPNHQTTVPSKGPISKPRKRLTLPLRFRRFFGGLGPGLITGAADDDPSGISTYSVTGAAFGYAPLWTALFSFPLMTAVQMMCARLGMVTGQGLAGVIRQRYPRWVLWGACALLVTANTVNIGADLGGMAKVAEMVTGVESRYWTPVYALVIASFLIWSSYYTFARLFKWLTLVLFAYVLAAFFARPDWSAVIRSTFIPHVEWSGRYWATLVGIFGTTISPYLFFWQASQGVEEDREDGKSTIAARKGTTTAKLRKSRDDTVAGMLFSNLIMYFIILTTAATLHAHGKTVISTAQDAAEALRPLAGDGAYWLFSLGLIGSGMLGVPVLAGSSAYAVSEALHWRGSLTFRPKAARGFYGVIAVGLLLGIAMEYAGINAVAMMFWSAVLNGVLAPPLIVIVLLLTSSRQIMGSRFNPPWLKVLGWITVVVMTGASVAMFATWG
ncbi:MAG TPA: divalent metal cation transporter [Bryobacteraceae bacterium]|jgi:NRAMP (natural resistance-associated macrophage protein)-like metal ion transporter|nr:divalent metal cation transporter [Bryobacteraceae bacterium]